MNQGFFELNNSAISQIMDFVRSSYGIFYLFGPKGSSKSETIEKVVPELEKNYLIFRHFCFENSVIDDFLLNFYDSLKNFSLSGKVAFKKFATDDFKEKVSHYLKTLDKKCIIIIENYEKIDTNKEIADFLIHLSNYPNVKILIVSRNKNTILHGMSIKTFQFEGISKEDFKSKLSILMNTVDEETKENFYIITQGIELYLNMSIKYCTNTNITISDLINEFTRRNEPFEHFIVSKFITLTPSNYRDFYSMLSILSHPVNTEFIESYKLGNTNYIEYLLKNFLVSKYNNEIYVKDYFKEYVKENLSLQDKANYYNKLVKIYEKELTKSPKDRLLRLSRESIRKEIEFLKSKIPSINTQQSKSISYIGMTSFELSNEALKPKSILRDKLDRIKERKRQITDEEKAVLAEKRLKESGQISLVDINREKNRSFIVNLINEARNESQNYKYKEANKILLRALNMDFDNEFRIELCNLIAQNYNLLNEFQNALNYYEDALNCAIAENDSRICQIRCSIAQLNKKFYKNDEAKELFTAIAANQTYSDKYRAIASIELGEIEESQGNTEHAKKHYENSLALSLGQNKELSAKGYYRLAVLYDEDGDIENAVKYYKKNYTLSSQHYENKYYSISLTNLASIYTEQGKYQEASDFLQLALSFDSEIDDLENMYYSQKELARLFSKINSKKALSYYKQALASATKLNDSFKTALVYFEAGEFFYDAGEDERALENFFSAKQAIGNNPNDENIARINSRIQDIKMRLNSVNFNIIADKFNK